MAFSYTKLACVLLICVAVAAPAAEAAITCGKVSSSLVQCLPYLKGQGAGPSPACCAGVRSLAGLARSTPDRQTACGCLKSTSSNIPGLKPANAAALPGKCSVSVGYPISTSVDCSRVH